MNKKVKVKKDGEYYLINVKDLMRGIEQTETKKDKVKVVLTPTIVKVQVGENIKVTHRLRGINRVMPISDWGNLISKISSWVPHLSGQVKRLILYYKDKGGIPYKSEKGLVFTMALARVNGGYRLVKDELLITRTEEEADKRQGRKIIYPNIYDSSIACWGRSKPLLVNGVEESVKIINQFLTSYVNQDLSKIRVSAGVLKRMADELEEVTNAVPREVKNNVKDILNYFKTLSNSVSVDMFVLIMLADLHGKDVDWIQSVIYKN